MLATAPSCTQPPRAAMVLSPDFSVTSYRGPEANEASVGTYEHGFGVLLPQDFAEFRFFASRITFCIIFRSCSTQAMSGPHWRKGAREHRGAWQDTSVAAPSPSLGRS